MIGSNPFQGAGGQPGGGCGGGIGGHQNGGPNSPTGPTLGPGSELRRLWNMPTTMGHASAVQCMSMVDDKVYTGGRDSALLMWRGNKGQRPGEFELVQDGQGITLASSPTCMLYEPASKWLFLGCWRGEVQAYCKDPMKECRLEGHRQCVSSIAIHSSVVISGSADATVRLWTPNQQAGTFQACGQPLQNPSGPVNVVKVFNDSLWAGGEQGITCFDLNTLQAKGTIPSPAGVSSMFDMQGYMLVAYKNGEVKIFDAAGAQTYLHPPTGEHTTNTAVEIMTHPYENKPMLLCGQQFGYVTAYDLPDFRPRGTLCAKNQSDIRSIVDVKADGMFLTAGQHGDIMVWQWQQGGSGGIGASNGPVASNPFAPAGGGAAMGAPAMAANPFAPSPGAGGFGMGNGMMS